MNRNQELGAIASNVQAVLRSFHDLAHHVASDAASPSINPLLTKFEDEMTRFKMWAGNLGAHQAGRASLDHRLREAPHLQEQVIYLLKDLSESLQDAVAMAVHEQPSWHKASPPNADEDNTKALDDSSDSGFTDSDEEDISPEARLSTIYTDVGEAIDCLLRLSVAIANPAPHERVRKLDTSEDISFYEKYDISYVRDKLPKMSDELAGVLGKSITRRRQFFKYREAHHARLAEGLEVMALDTEVDTSRTEIVPKTVASSLPDHLKKLTNVDLRTDAIDEDGRSEMGMSQTSYATSAGFLAEDVDGQMKEPPPPLKVPPLPAAAERGSFECPFCYRMVSASSSGAWKRHVFGDLRPYTCLFSGCMEFNTDFDRRHRWQLHVSQYHWRSWFCPFKCEGTFPSKIELEHHINHQHMPNAPEDHVNAAAALGEKSASDDTANNCPLCAHTVVGLKPYVKHVGRHLEQLALYALPSLDDENSEDGGDSDEQNSAASEAKFSDGNSSYAPSTSPSLRRRLDEPEAVFAEIALQRDDEVVPETERLRREFGTNDSPGDAWDEAQHEYAAEGEQAAAVEDAFQDAAKAEGVTAEAAAEPDPQQPVSGDMISPIINMQTRMHQLSPEDRSRVTELALRMMRNASEQTKARHRAQLHQILPQHQREELQAQGKDLALWFYETQSLQVLEANTVQSEFESVSPSDAPSMQQEQQQHGHTGFFISEGGRPVPRQSGQDIPIQVFAEDNEVEPTMKPKDSHGGQTPPVYAANDQHDLLEKNEEDHPQLPGFFAKTEVTADHVEPGPPDADDLKLTWNREMQSAEKHKMEEAREERGAEDSAEHLYEIEKNTVEFFSRAASSAEAGEGLSEETGGWSRLQSEYVTGHQRVMEDNGNNLDNELHLGISGSEVTNDAIMTDSSEHLLSVGRILKELGPRKAAEEYLRAQAKMKIEAETEAHIDFVKEIKAILEADAEARKLAEEETQAQAWARAFAVAEARSKLEEEMRKEEAAEQEYERRLEDDLRRSGLDDLAIAAILAKERAQKRQNKERILAGGLVPVVEVPPDMLRKGTEHETEANPDESKKEDERLPIKFKDAVGRKFSFPFHLCQTWQGMEALIKQAFLHVDVVGPHVEEGHYDIVGPNDEFILPSVWEKVIEPGWSLTMVMWPIAASEGAYKTKPISTSAPEPSDTM